MTWTPFTFRSMRKSASRPNRRPRLVLESLETRLAPAVNVLTYHDDLASSGLNAAEVQLSPANVHVGSFGKLFTTAVDGQVYAEPLIDTGIAIANGPNTLPGAAGVHDVVFVATENDSLYAIDAGMAGGAILWQRSFLDPGNPGGDVNNTLGASAIAVVTSAEVGSFDITPIIGITGTPVIDPATGTLYLVAKTRETVGGATHFVQRLHAINIADGTDVAAPYLIGDTTGGNLNNTPIYVYGQGDGAVTDPVNGTGQSVVQFNALREHQRGALSLVNGTVYVEWASHGDQGPYHGWVAAWNVANLAASGFVLQGVLNTSPNGGEAGVWQGGGRLAFEPDGSAFYFETGNGSPGHGAPALDANGFPADADYYEALIQVVADPTTDPTHQNANGWGFKVADYFIPFDQVALDTIDRDFGSGAPLLLPDAAGLPGHPHLLVAAGKEGKVYLVDRDHLGKFSPTADNVLNAVPDGSGVNTPPVQLSGSLSTAAYFNGAIYWTAGYSGPAQAFAIGADSTLAVTSQTTASFGYLPGSAVVSANGTLGGIVWVMDRATNAIHAYDARTLATELWNSGQKSGGGDALGAVVKFAVPTVANGEVYVGTSDSLVVYGLTPPANAAPSPPVLTGTALSGTSINLSWSDATTPPNTANGYQIEQSLDGTSFTPVTTAPSGASAIAIGGLTPLTTYYFRVEGFNGLGLGGPSNVFSATTTSQAAVLDFSGGFAGAAAALTLNGSAVLNGASLELTDNHPQEAGSAFANNPMDISRFSTQFTFQIPLGANTADGFTFTIQANGPTTLGGVGGSLGYGPDASGQGGIPHSIAIKFDLFDNNGEGPNSTGLFADGAVPDGLGAIDLSPAGLDLHSGDVFLVTMVYDGTSLTVTIADSQTGRSATQVYAIDIPGTLGGTMAYAGFTGGSGTATATQNILTWTFAPKAPQAPAVPTGLGAVPASATSVRLAWANNATDQAGFHLDRATDASFTQNLITLTLPAVPTTFTDTASGLAPGGTFYYRLRAFNTGGDSASTNTVAVTIPLAPPTPTAAQVTGVTTNAINLVWTDNAGTAATGYHILRSTPGGTFATVATLPARVVPGPYTWSDMGLAPGTTYEYHIQAFNIAGNNDFTGTNATTLTLAPTNLAATAGDGVVNLSWTAAAGALTYNIYRSATAGGEAVVPIATGVPAALYADRTVNNGTTYFYIVSAVNANVGHVPPLPAESAVSAEASALPMATGFAYDAGGTALTITGTTFTFGQTTTADAAGTHTIDRFTIDGHTQSFADATLARVTVNAVGTHGTATLYTLDTYTGTDHQTHETAETVILWPGGGAMLRARPDGGVTFLQFNNFPVGDAYLGRADLGEIYATTGEINAFATHGLYSTMTSASQVHFLWGAPVVYGFAANPSDYAVHTDGSGPGRYVASGTSYSSMSGTDQGQAFFNEALGFRYNTGQATHSGDTATFYDSLGIDYFVANRTSSYMAGYDAHGNLNEFDQAIGFDLVYAYAFVGAIDYAYNHDPSHNHTTGFHLLG